MSPDVVIRRMGVGDRTAVEGAGSLFDARPDATATDRFLGSSGHHLLIAFEGDAALGFVTGVEMTHPDKGTEMFLYELGVAEEARGRGIGSALVDALAALARERGCYGMWVLTEPDNAAALATYRRAGGETTGASVLLEWRFT